MTAAAILAAIESYRGTMLDNGGSSTVPGELLGPAVSRLGRQLTAHGLEPGQRVVLAVPNGSGFVVALGAVLAAHGTPVLAHAQAPPAGLLRLARRWHCHHLLSGQTTGSVTTGSVTTGSVTTDRATTELPSPLCLGEDRWPELRWHRLAEETAGDDPLPSLPGVPLHQTSGTTGEPKLALRPGPAAVAEAAHYIETINIGSADTILCLTPMSHAYAYGMCCMVPLLSSANLITMSSFNPRLTGRILGEHRVTILPAVPAILGLLRKDRLCRELTSMPRVLTAGAPLTTVSASAFHEQLGSRPCPLYGTTETGGISVALAGLDQGVGPPMNGVSVRLSPVREGNDGGDEIGEGEIGEVQIRSSSMMTGYLAPGGVETSVVRDGWFATNDLGRLDDNGCLHLVGRRSEVINVFGLKVLPCEVEEVICEHPGVTEVKVYAGRHRSGSSIVKAAVVTAEQCSAADIMARCRDHLDAYKCPQAVVFLDELPRSPAGKILVAELP